MVDEMNRVSEANTEFFDSAGPEDHRGSQKSVLSNFLSEDREFFVWKFAKLQYCCLKLN